MFSSSLLLFYDRPPPRLRIIKKSTDSAVTSLRSHDSWGKRSLFRTPHAPPPPIPVPEPFAVTRDITDRFPSLDCESSSRMVVYSFRGCVRLPRRVTHPAGSGTEDDLQRRGRRLRAPALQRWRLLKRLSDTRVERSSAPVYCVPAWAATAARSEGGSGLVDAAICVITF